VLLAVIAGSLSGPPLASSQKQELIDPESGAAFAPLQPHVQRVAAGQLDWTSLIASAWGKSLWVPRPGKYGWELKVKKKARLDAEAHLLSVLKAIPLTAELALRDKPELLKKARQFMNSAQPAEERKQHGKYFELKLELLLHGDHGLASILRSTTDPSDEVRDHLSASPILKSDGPTAVVVDARGLGAKAVLWPRLLDEEGSVLLDFGESGKASAGRFAAVIYLAVKPVSAATRGEENSGAAEMSRLGGRPFLLQAARAEGGHAGDLVLGSPAISSLMETDGAMALARESGIVILLEPLPLSIQNVQRKPPRKRSAPTKRPSLLSTAPDGD
jgi:hypothetical protein